MAIKHIIAKGIGFADVGDNLKYIPTHGFDIGVGTASRRLLVGVGRAIVLPLGHWAMTSGGTMRLTTLAFLFVALAGTHGATAHFGRAHDGSLLPDPHVTPGVVVHHDKAAVCGTSWGKDARHVTEAMKRHVVEAYGLERAHVVGQGKGPCCELDHLIPRELGGADDVKNLWPQAWVEAHKKDTLENFLHREVCAGRMGLQLAQREIADNWALAYLKMTNPDHHP